MCFNPTVARLGTILNWFRGSSWQKRCWEPFFHPSRAFGGTIFADCVGERVAFGSSRTCSCWSAQRTQNSPYLPSVASVTLLKLTAKSKVEHQCQQSQRQWSCDPHVRLSTIYKHTCTWTCLCVTECVKAYMEDTCNTSRVCERSQSLH